ncbi:18 kDa heat shock protein [Streptomyces jeddahensis]|uniref:18 kDa heat shock protein n=1 Tax=Streptomyces jeddahensis TaxID=1716141 RepID=A0A177HGR2_9ACTN|nr:18 kDa heat shock protein [Streptomyces jeddahensis]
MFRWQLFLGETLSLDKVEASYDAGVLTVRIPEAEEARPRKIEIGRGDETKEIAG